MRLLVVTAVAAERDSAATGLHTLGDPAEHGIPGHRLLRTSGGGPLHAGLIADLIAGGVGPAAAASAASAALTAAALTDRPYHLVIAAGIAGGFVPVAPVGSVVVADSIVAADLGADSPEGFLPVDELGFGRSTHRPPQPLCGELARSLGAVTGAVLTASTVTGSAERAAQLAARYPDAVAEAMEGFGVAEAAAAHGVPVIEIRAVSNPVGPRDRGTWRIGDALAALADAFTALPPFLQSRLDSRDSR